MSELDEVVVRLRAADAADGADAHDRGFAAGTAWARDRARPRELRRLDRSMRAWSGGRSIEAVLRGLAAGGGRIAIGLCEIVAGGDPDGLEASGYWSDLLGDPAGGDVIDDVDFAVGFVLAALAVWDSVEDRVGSR